MKSGIHFLRLFIKIGFLPYSQFIVCLKKGGESMIFDTRQRLGKIRLTVSETCSMAALIKGSPWAVRR